MTTEEIMKRFDRMKDSNVYWEEDIPAFIYKLVREALEAQEKEFIKTREDAVREALEKVDKEVNQCDRFCLDIPTKSMKRNDIGAYMYGSDVISIVNKHKNI